MKLKRAIAAMTAAVCMCLCLSTGASAADIEDKRFQGKSWDQIMTTFLEEHKVNREQITVGFYNTVTEEEHYINPDQLMYGASVAKLPTNMLYAERIYKGEMDFSTSIGGNSYASIQKCTLVNSDNPLMEVMVRDLGGGSYAEFRKKILPYIGETEETVDSKFLARNFFTPKQIMYTLKLLHSDPERYPGVIDKLKQASPEDYFRGNQPPYEIAHKYGWYTTDGVTYLNDSAIVYTDDPILLVMFTANLPNARAVLADYCSLMCDYAQYERSLRYAGEAVEGDYRFNDPIAFVTKDSPAYKQDAMNELQIICLGVGIAVLVFGLTQIKHNKRIFVGALVISLVLFAYGLLSPLRQIQASIKNGEPEQVVTSFAKAYSKPNRGQQYLYNGETHTGTSLAENTLGNSLHIKVGKSRLSGKNAAVSVTGTRLSMEKISDAVATNTLDQLNTVLSDKNCPDLFDENGEYLPDAVNAAKDLALKQAMKASSGVTEEISVTLHLIYTTDGWKIIVDNALLQLCNYQ